MEYVRTLYWGVGLQGEVTEIVDDLSSWKKQIQNGGTTIKDAVNKMRNPESKSEPRVPEPKIAEFEQWAMEFERRNQRRGRRGGASPLLLRAKPLRGRADGTRRGDGTTGLPGRGADR